VEVVNLRVRGMITPKPQDEAKASYAPRLTKEDGRLDWTKPAWQLAREVRAYTPWPGSFSHIDGKLLKVLGATPRAAEHTPEPPGTVLPDLAVVTGEGELALERVQLEGRKPMEAGEFLRGQPGIVGSRLGPPAADR
jgi:methionyl-tRNA formyltransferase